MLYEYQVIAIWPDGEIANDVIEGLDFNHAYSEALAIYEGATIKGISELPYHMAVENAAT